MSSRAACMILAARYGTLALSVEETEGQWRFTVADAERNTVLHRGRATTLEDAKRCAEDLALIYQAAQSGSATLSEKELAWAAVT